MIKAFKMRLEYGGERASKKAVGLQGENRMRHALDDHLEPPDYIVLHDLLFPGLYGMPTQIDHLIVSRFGLFVVEMKNWMGDIVARKTRWVKCRGRRELRLPNPIKQNAHHAKALSERLNIPDSLIFGLVAVPRDAQFAEGLPEGVHYCPEVPQVIRAFDQPVIKPEQVPEIVGAVRAWCATVSPKLRREFTSRLKTRFHEK